jgi:hypothetical protein
MKTKSRHLMPVCNKVAPCDCGAFVFDGCPPMVADVADSSGIQTDLEARKTRNSLTEIIGSVAEH